MVYLSDDSSKEKPYIFSVSSYISSVELHYFDNEGNNSYKTWLNLDFFKIDDNYRHIFSYQFSLLEGKNNIYYAAYIQKKGINDGRDYGISYNISEFKFLDPNTSDLILNKEFDGNFDDRIISALIYEKYELLAIFFIKYESLKYTIRLHDLNTLELKQEITLNEIQKINNPNTGFGIFFKAIYLQYEYSAFIFFKDGNKGDTLELKFLKIIKKDSGHNVEYILSKKINSSNFDTSITLSEFYKINCEKLLFVSTIDRTYLIIMFFETYSWYQYINTRTYKFSMEGYKFINELTVDFFNDFLIFTSTIIPNGLTNEFEKSSILIFFSYPNGTDFDINIFPYFSDTEYYSNDNLISFLLNNMTIDNNIFNYTRINEIKLISIPDEIIFYREGNDTPLLNGECASQNHFLKQNKSLIKYNTIYSLDYQFMALGKEKNIDVFNQAHDKDIQYQLDEFKNNYTQKTYYGRVNRLTFKLCHDYCETCEELGNSNDDQKCLTCLPQYKYDYYYYNYPNFNNKNCAPEGYYIDIDLNQKLVKCNSTNSKYYFNKTDNNKKICFDISKDCPEEYPFLNETTNECMNYTSLITTIPIILTTTPVTTTTISTTTLTSILTTIPTTISKTIPTTSPTTVSNTIPTTVPTTVSNTIPTRVPTTIQTTIPITIPNTILTTIPNFFVTTIHNTILTTIPNSIITTIPNTIITTIPTNIPSTIQIISNKNSIINDVISINILDVNLNNNQIKINEIISLENEISSIDIKIKIINIPNDFIFLNSKFQEIKLNDELELNDQIILSKYKINEGPYNLKYKVIAKRIDIDFTNSMYNKNS